MSLYSAGFPLAHPGPLQCLIPDVRFDIPSSRWTAHSCAPLDRPAGPPPSDRPRWTSVSRDWTAEHYRSLLRRRTARHHRSRLRRA